MEHVPHSIALTGTDVALLLAFLWFAPRWLRWSKGGNQ